MTAPRGTPPHPVSLQQAGLEKLSPAPASRPCGLAGDTLAGLFLAPRGSGWESGHLANPSDGGVWSQGPLHSSERLPRAPAEALACTERPRERTRGSSPGAPRVAGARCPPCSPFSEPLPCAFPFQKLRVSPLRDHPAMAWRVISSRRDESSVRRRQAESGACKGPESPAAASAPSRRG